jgi:MFS family permease
VLSIKQYDLLRNRDFLRIWTATLVSATGRWCRIIAATMLIYSITESALAVSILWIIGIASSVLFAPLVGIVIDRTDRRRLMIISDFLRALLMLFLIEFAAHLLVVYVVFAMLSILGLLFDGAYQCVFPAIVGKENLVTGNSLQSLCGNVATVLGPVLAGAVVSLWGTEAAFFINALTYLFSAMCVYHITAVSPPRDQERNARASYWSEINYVAGYMAKNRTVKTLLIMETISMFGFGALTALMIVFAKDALNADVLGFGSLYSAESMGSIIGALALAFVAKGNIKHKGALVSLAYTVLSLTTIAFAFSRSVVVAIVVLVLEGVFVAFQYIAVQTLLQEVIPDEYRGRVLMGFAALVNVVTLASMGLAGIAGDIFGIRSVFLLAGALCFISACIGWLRLRELSTDVSWR